MVNQDSLNDPSAPPAGQSWNPARYADNARFNVDLAGPILALLAPVRGERVLDLGCGDGALTARLVDAGCAVVGLDASPELLEAARERGLDVVLGDAEELSYDACFDAVFSNAALHWMCRPDAVIRGVARALRPGGRFVAEFGGHGCVAAIRTALHAVIGGMGHDARVLDPWYFPTPRDYRERLERGGFDVKSVELVPRPTLLAGGLGGWLDTFAERFLLPLTAEQKAQALDSVENLLRPMLCDSRGEWTADYTRLRVSAAKRRS